MKAPTIPVKTVANQTEIDISTKKQFVMKKDQLLEGIKELEEILNEVERLKKLASSAEDWRVLMLYIATQKPRISALSSFSKRVYVEDFAEAYDSQYELSEGEKGPSNKTAEIRAKRASGLAYEIAERFDRTWKDLEALLWVCKDLAGSLDHQEQEAATFNAYPEHMFPDIAKND